LHIASAVEAEATRLKFRRVGLLGTQAVMQGSVYQPILEPRGIDILLPQPPERVRLDRIIRAELIRGAYTLQSRAFVLDIISTMAAQGAEAVILGCTELPLLLQEEEPVVPLLDSTRILAIAALQRVIPCARPDDVAPAVLLTSN
jgi:aspartate racemase